MWRSSWAVDQATGVCMAVATGRTEAGQADRLSMCPSPTEKGRAGAADQHRNLPLNYPRAFEPDFG